MLCNVVMVSAVHQHRSVVIIRIFPPTGASLLPHPAPLGCRRPGAELPVSCSRFPLAVYFTSGNTYIRVFQRSSPKSSHALPSSSMSTSLFSVGIFLTADSFIGIIFLDVIYMHINI